MDDRRWSWASIVVRAVETAPPKQPPVLGVDQWSGIDVGQSEAIDTVSFSEKTGARLS